MGNIRRPADEFLAVRDGVRCARDLTLSDAKPYFAALGGLYEDPGIRVRAARQSASNLSASAGPATGVRTSTCA